MKVGEWDWCWDENKIVIIMWSLNSKHRISEAAKRTKENKGKRDRNEHVIRYRFLLLCKYVYLQPFNILSKKYPPKNNKYTS